jgi:hypothetical protein
VNTLASVEPVEIPCDSDRRRDEWNHHWREIGAGVEKRVSHMWACAHDCRTLPTTCEQPEAVRSDQLVAPACGHREPIAGTQTCMGKLYRRRRKTRQGGIGADHDDREDISTLASHG